MVAVLAAMIIGTTLTGCENARIGPLALSVANDQLVVATCAAIEAEEVEMAEKGGRWGASWTTFWESSYPVALAPGDVISLSDAPPGSVSPAQMPELAPGNVIDVEIRGTTDRSTRLAAQFSIGAEGLVEGTWVHPDGTSTSAPCP